MALTKLQNGRAPRYLALSSDISGNAIEGANIVGATIFLTDTLAWKIIKPDLTLAPLTYSTHSGGSTFGDGSNYTEFSATGFMSMVGEATPWDDLRIEPVARTTGSNAPAFEKWYDDAAGTSRGVYLYSFDDAASNAEKEIFFTMQLPHSWASTAITLHVHWVGNTSDTTAAPRWGLEYAWQNIGETFGDTTIVYTVSKTPVDADITAGKHYISAFADITPTATQNKLSSILICRLFRNSSNAADTYDVGGNKCGLLYIDAHYEINSIGSDTPLTK